MQSRVYCIFLFEIPAMYSLSHNEADIIYFIIAKASGKGLRQVVYVPRYNRIHTLCSAFLFCSFFFHCCHFLSRRKKKEVTKGVNSSQEVQKLHCPM